MDCGGIYMLERKSQDLVMAVHIGLSDEYIANYKRFIQGSEQYQLVMKGDTIYQQHLDALVKDPIIENEGLHCLGLIPLHSKNKVVACIQVASHTHNTIPPSSRDTLEGLSVHIGSLIARFQVQDELAESQNELKSLFDSLQDFVFVLDEQGNILQVNQLVLNRLGYGRQELIGRNVVEIHPREERRLAWQSVQDMLAGLKDTCLLNLLRTDGLPVPVETKVVRGRWGTRDALIEVSRDITERKAAEQAQNLQQALLEYRRHFEEILTNISMHLINFTGNDIDPEINDVLRQIGEFEQVDRSYVFLINRQTALMKNTHEWYAPGIEPQIHQLQNLPTNMFPWGMEKLEKLEEVYIPVISELPSEAQIEREILETKAIQSILVVPLVSQNIMTGFLGFDSVTRQRTWSTDSILLIKMVGNIISNTLMRAQMENDLRQSEERTRALLSAIPDLIFRVRRDGIVLDYKAGSNELLAIPPDQVVGSSMAQVFNKYMAEKSMVCMEHALQRKEIQTMEYNLKIDDSSHVVEARFINSGADEVIAMVRDISGRARLEQMKSDFINKATHELRTPIATMLLMASLIDGSSSSEEFEEYWEVLKGELDREQILVEDLLTAGRLESDQVELHFQNLDIRELIQQVVQHMQPTAREKDITITPPKSSELFDFPMYIQADESALAQAFINLLNNAIKFTPYGGQVEVLLQRANSGYEVSIIDNGIGIPSEDLPLLFSRFFRGSNAIKNEIPGTGIGLFIVRSIVEKHGGRIKVLSELNNGSQFDIWLPRVETELDYYNFL
jgi:PAS domain S-box-containing protein